MVELMLTLITKGEANLGEIGWQWKLKGSGFGRWEIGKRNEGHWTLMGDKA